jgi:hypothetical protein
LRTAAYYGAVAASFCIEEIGVLHWDDSKIAERDRRFNNLANRDLNTTN